MYIDCGDTDRYDGSTFGHYNIGVQAWVWDRSSTQNVTCSMKLVDAGGNVWFSGASKSTTGSDLTFEKYLSWDSLGNYGSAYISCLVPKASGGNYSGVAALVANHWNG